MYTKSEETQCSDCIHLEVCSLKKEFLTVQNAVNNLTVSLGNRTMKDLRDFNWIKRVNLECTYFAPKRSSTVFRTEANQACGTALCASEGKFMEDPT